LLKHLGIGKPLQRFDDHAGQREAAAIAAALRTGKTVAYCSDAGMPGINDPGFELARLAREAGAEVEVLPGPSVVTLAAVASGLPTHAFSFLGYLPAKSEARRTFIRQMAAREETCIIFETQHRIEDTLKDLHEIIPDRELALGRELTKLHEEWYRGRPSSILAHLGTERRGEFVFAVAGAGAKRVIENGLPPDGQDQLPESDGQSQLPEWAGKFLDAAREGGMTLREAAKPLARHLGKTPSEVYKMAAERK
jgi:16S rRNA (cytidine1402-2'-O)-methyltransferase